MVTPVAASGHRIKPAGPVLSRNSSSNKASTAQLESLIRSGICEKPSTEFSLQIFGALFYKLAR
jgi:hypothetical protein